MIMFENLQSMNIDEFVEWFAENCVHDNDPSIRWFDETYCKNCECVVKDGIEYGYCELNDKCRFFQHIDGALDNKQTIKLWLQSEIKGEKRECPDCRYFAGCSAYVVGKACDLFIEK